MDEKLLKSVKIALRITTDDAGINTEVSDLLEAAFADLLVAGIVNKPAQGKIYSPLYQRAITLYCKANFGSSPDAARLAAAYESLKAYMSLDPYYKEA